MFLSFKRIEQRWSRFLQPVRLGVLTGLFTVAADFCERIYTVAAVTVAPTRSIDSVPRGSE